MAELTLERIAELRATMGDTRRYSNALLWSGKDLLDAAERGLLNDRKAAAFDRLAEFKTFEVMDLDHNLVAIYIDVDESSHGPTLLEAIEALPTNGEPK